MYRHLIFLTLLLITLGARAELPSISSANSSALQMDQEYRLGQAWVRMVRGRANLYDDPVVESYLQGLLSRLAPVSELEDQRLTLELIDSAEVNAFAAPGGIIGINAGLMLAAQREDELASVIAHELAHLSQRHYAQQQAASERSKPLVLAGILVASYSLQSALTLASLLCRVPLVRPPALSSPSVAPTKQTPTKRACAH